MSLRSLVKKVYFTPVVQQLFLKTVKPFYPPPYEDPLMELRHSIWIGISSIHCHDGRQLGENNAGPKMFKENLPTRCRESGLSNENGKLLINITALEGVMRNWDAAIEFVLAMRDIYLQKYCPDRRKFTLFDVFFFAKMCVCVPAYQARRSPPLSKDGEIDVVSATQFQLISGMFMIVREMIDRGESWLDADLVYDAEAIFDYGVEHGVFNTEAGYTCAGSKRKILEFMGVVTGEIARESLVSIADIEKDYLGRDLNSFISYFENAVSIELLVKLGRTLTAKTFYGASQDFKGQVLSMNEYFNAHQGMCFNSKDSLSIIETQEKLLLMLLSFPDKENGKIIQEQIYKDCEVLFNKSESSNVEEETKRLADGYFCIINCFLNLLQSHQNKLQESLGKQLVTVSSDNVHRAIGAFSYKSFKNSSNLL